MQLLTECESHPDQWFQDKARDMYNSNLKRVAKFLGLDFLINTISSIIYLYVLYFVGASPDNVVFVNNPTTAINTVLTSLSLTEEDGILCNTHTYPAVLNTIDFQASKWNAQVHTVELRFPITCEEQVVNVSELSM